MAHAVNVHAFKTTHCGATGISLKTNQLSVTVMSLITMQLQFTDYAFIK